MKIHATNPDGLPTSHSLNIVMDDGTECQFPGQPYKWNLSMEVGKAASCEVWLHSTGLNIVAENTAMFTTIAGKTYKLVEVE